MSQMLRYCSHSRQSLAVWRRKNVIQVFAGFFLRSKTLNKPAKVTVYWLASER